jgi:hypothetical protein
MGVLVPVAFLLQPFGLGNVGEGAIKFAQAVQHDAAIDIGCREFRIELDRLVEIGHRAGQVAVAIGDDAVLPKRLGVAGGGRRNGNRDRRRGRLEHGDEDAAGIDRKGQRA